MYAHYNNVFLPRAQTKSPHLTPFHYADWNEQSAICTKQNNLNTGNQFHCAYKEYTLSMFSILTGHYRKSMNWLCTQGHELD